jgi:hypothetical protein
MTRPSPEELLEEAARLAYHYHWPLETILDLEHEDRRLFLRRAEEMAAPRSQEESWAGDEPVEQLWE